MTISLKTNQMNQALQNAEKFGLNVLEEDPSAETNNGKIYTKEVDGYTELHYLDDYGLATQITNKGATLGGSVDLYIDEFTASGGDEDFTLTETPASNVNTPSGYSILSVTVNGVSLSYSSSPSDSFEFGYSTGDIVTKSLLDGDLVEVRYFV